MLVEFYRYGFDFLDSEFFQYDLSVFVDTIFTTSGLLHSKGIFRYSTSILESKTKRTLYCKSRTLRFCLKVSGVPNLVSVNKECQDSDLSGSSSTVV